MKSRAKFRIGVDIDGVIADMIGGVLPLINYKLGTSYKVEDWNQWGFIESVSDMSIGELLGLMEVSWEKEFIKPLEPNIAQTLAQIKRIGSLIIISKRTYKSHAKVIETLQRWGVKYDGIVLLDGDGEKQDYPIDVLIDDYPKIGYSEMPLIVIDQPWNQEIKQDWHTLRVNNLVETLPILKELRSACYGG